MMPASTLQNAQYAVTGRAGNFGLSSPVAYGLTWQEACELVASLTVFRNKFWPTPRFGAPSFLPGLRMPIFVRKGPAEIGDYVAQSVYTHSRRTGADGSASWGKSFVVSKVASINGAELSLLEPGGKLTTCSEPVSVFSAKQFDVAGVDKDIYGRWQRHLQDKAFGPPWGYFQHVFDVAHTLRQHLIPVEKVLPTRDGLSRIIGFPVEGDFLPARWTSPVFELV